ncbi:MAG: 2-dehydropantoate 2-reductase [Candidatus Omnitrophota bacterium]|nr:2-dehydropantoate 2-reductase [Candidatus Omnitrophota bacterium]
MKIAVIGAGAIGSLAAGYLADKNEQVVLIARPGQISVISQDGLRIEGVRGSLSVRLPVKEKLDENIDLAILAAKTQDLEKTVMENYAYLKNANILSVQNGIRAEEVIANKLGRDNLFASIVMFGATYLGPGKIVHNFEGDWILGRLTPTANGALEKIKKVTSKVFSSPLSDDIIAMKWVKLFLNANNCLPAILGKSMQETFKNISVCKISLGIWREGWSLVNQARIKLTALPNFPLERITGLISLPPEEAAGIFSNIMINLSKKPLYGSILQSIKRNRLSEIDYINGEFVNLAESMGQKALLNERLVQLVHNVEKSGEFLSEEELINETKSLL